MGKIKKMSQDSVIKIPAIPAILQRSCMYCRKLVAFLSENLDEPLICPNCGKKMIPHLEFVRQIKFKAINDEADKIVLSKREIAKRNASQEDTFIK